MAEFSEEELERKTRELEEIFNLGSRLSMGMAKNPSRLSQARQGGIWRGPMVLREKKGGSGG